MNKKTYQEVQTKLASLEKEIIESNETIKEFTYALNDFSEKVDPKNAKEHRSYVYALCEKVGKSLVPFYIGEGKGPRVWSHELAAKNAPLEAALLEAELAELEDEGRLAELEKIKGETSDKIKKIREIRERNGEIVKYIIKWGMTSKEAFMAESALINLLNIGGLKFDSSCEGNQDKLTNIVQGHQSEGEKQVGSINAKTVEEFCEEFAKKPLFFEDLQRKNVKAVLININRGYPECLKYANGEARKKAIRDTVCGNWAMREKEELKSLGIEYVFATVQARVVGIFKIKEVNGEKFHYMYESVNKNSEYPHGKETVSFRNFDYENAKTIVEWAKEIKKDPAQLVLDDMPKEYRDKFKKNVAKDKNPDNVFVNNLKRIYMILEDIPENDPNYKEFSGYLYRRIIHTDKWVENKKIKKQMKLEKIIKSGVNKRIPNPDKVTNSVYGYGNPYRYINGKIEG